MRIALAADHAGYLLKDELAAWLREAGHEVTDLGTNGPESVDYPEYGAQLADAVASGSLLAPMPGTVVSVAVEQGQRVEAGQPVLELRADDDSRFARAVTALEGAIEIGEQPPAAGPLVIERIAG